MIDKNLEKLYEEKYPVKDFSKTIYTFSPEELRKLQSLDTIVQMGQMAQTLVNGVIEGQCLKRVGTKNSSDIGVLYNIPSAQFFVYTPKVWCSVCGNKRAKQQYDGKAYCDTCIEAVKVEKTIKKEEKK